MSPTVPITSVSSPNSQCDGPCPLVLGPTHFRLVIFSLSPFDLFAACTGGRTFAPSYVTQYDLHGTLSAVPV